MVPKSSHDTLARAVALMACLSSAGPAHAEEAATDYREHLYLELEPLNFFNDGWSFLVHVPVDRHWHLGSNVFSQNLPALFRDALFDIQGSDPLAVRQRVGVNFGPRYFFVEDGRPRGWLVSLPVGYEDLEITSGGGERLDYFMVYAGPRAGYLWRPGLVDEGLYLLAEVGAIIPLASSGRSSLAGSSIRLRPVVPLLGVGFGYSF